MRYGTRWTIWGSKTAQTSRPLCGYLFSHERRVDTHTHVERDGDDGVIVTFSDRTTGAYVVEELLKLRPHREPTDRGSARWQAKSVTESTSFAFSMRWKANPTT